MTDLEEIDAILKRSQVCRVAFSVDNEPYIVPLSYGYDPAERSLYFHTAEHGKKTDCIDRNPHVCFEVEGNITLHSGGRRGCEWTIWYESVVGYGTVFEVCDATGKERGLRALMRQHAAEVLAWTFDEAMVAKTRVWRLEIDMNTLRGKRAP